MTMPMMPWFQKANHIINHATSFLDIPGILHENPIPKVPGLSFFMNQSTGMPKAFR